VTLPSGGLRVGIEAVTYHATPRQFSVLTASVSASFLQGRIIIGGGLGASFYRDTTTFIIPPSGPAQVESTTWTSGGAEIHLAVAVPVPGHLALGPYFMYATSLGGFPSGGRSIDRDLIHFGVAVLWR
jgi:uncharacterized membrane protein